MMKLFKGPAWDDTEVPDPITGPDPYAVARDTDEVVADLSALDPGFGRAAPEVALPSTAWDDDDVPDPAPLPPTAELPVISKGSDDNDDDFLPNPRAPVRVEAAFPEIGKRSDDDDAFVPDPDSPIPPI